MIACYPLFLFWHRTYILFYISESFSSFVSLNHYSKLLRRICFRSEYFGGLWQNLVYTIKKQNVKILEFSQKPLARVKDLLGASGIWTLSTMKFFFFLILCWYLSLFVWLQNLYCWSLKYIASLICLLYRNSLAWLLCFFTLLVIF